MTLKIFQTKRFSRQYKKLHKNILQIVNQEIRVICDNPIIGERKKGDLSHLYVHKFYAQKQLYLLGYTLDDHCRPRLISLESLGAHENFYRDIKRNL